VLHLKKLTTGFEVRQNSRKIQNGVENLCFRVFAPKGRIFARFQNPFLHSKHIFGIQLLWKKLFSENQNGGLVQNGGIFWEKIDLYFSGSGHRKLSFFFQSLKANLLCADPKCAKKIAKKIKMVEIFKMTFAVLDNFTEKSFHRKFVNKRPFDRNTI
jgi:hypothetical protein